MIVRSSQGFRRVFENLSVQDDAYTNSFSRKCVHLDDGSACITISFAIGLILVTEAVKFQRALCFVFAWSIRCWRRCAPATTLHGSPLHAQVLCHGLFNFTLDRTVSSRTLKWPFGLQDVAPTISQYEARRLESALLYYELSYMWPDRAFCFIYYSVFSSMVSRPTSIKQLV